jgi:hypothetical protein
VRVRRRMRVRERRRLPRRRRARRRRRHFFRGSSILVSRVARKKLARAAR